MWRVSISEEGLTEIRDFSSNALFSLVDGFQIHERHLEKNKIFIGITIISVLQIKIYILFYLLTAIYDIDYHQHCKNVLPK